MWLFKSPSIKIHLLRGLAGLGFLAVALLYEPVLGWWTVVPGAGALIALGG